MYKAMIVDDEPMIRFGVKASVDWTQLQVDMVGDYANGKDALDAMRAQPIDLLLTDIKMPVMDGITLSRRALALNPRLRVILISSYNDFEYVREGLRLGVVDYILKHTLEPEELKRLVTRCTEELDRTHRAVEGLTRRAEQTLRRYLASPPGAGVPRALPAWLSEGFVAACIRLDDVERLEEQVGSLTIALVMEELLDMAREHSGRSLVFRSAEHELHMLMPGGEETVASLAALKREMERRAEVSLSVGWAAGRGADDVKRTVMRSGEACRRRFFHGTGSMHADAPQHPAPHEEPDDGRLVAIKEALRLVRLEEASRLLDARMAEWIRGGLAEDAIKREACGIVSALSANVADTALLLEQLERIRRVETLADLIGRVRLSLEESGRFLSGGRPVMAAGARRMIEQATAYIEARYIGPLSLQQVADHVHVSKNHFCLLFKKHTGHNFIDYVIQLRIRKARELLLDRELRIYEVAEQAGFNDVKYFSKLFKKLIGMSPGEYRAVRVPAAERDGPEA